MRMAKVMSWVSVLLMGSGAGWWIVGTCRSVGRVGLHPFVWTANNILLWWPSWIVTGHLNGFRISLHEFLLEHILLRLASDIWDIEGKNPVCTVSPVIWWIAMHVPWFVLLHGGRSAGSLPTSRRLQASSNIYLFQRDLPPSLVCLVVGRLPTRHSAHLTRLIWLTGLQLRSVLGVYEWVYFMESTYLVSDKIEIL